MIDNRYHFDEDEDCDEERTHIIKNKLLAIFIRFQP